MNASDIVSFTKIAEGGFNRVFEIKIRNGTQILARLPYPSTHPKRYAVASEVATLDFLRHNGIPVPKVTDYCIDSEGPVGAEYILMERALGKPLGDQWFASTEKERLGITLGLVQLEAKLFSIDLPAYGSLHYARDLPRDTRRLMLPTVSRAYEKCISCSTTQSWWFEERGLLEIDRGPCQFFPIT